MLCRTLSRSNISSRGSAIVAASSSSLLSRAGVPRPAILSSFTSSPSRRHASSFSSPASSVRTTPTSSSASFSSRRMSLAAMPSAEHVRSLQSVSEAVEVVDAFPALPARLVITCEHASTRLPEGWGPKWPPGDEHLCNMHWSFDAGAEEFTRELAARLPSVAVLARFSRLLCDANRPLDSDTLFRSLADGKPVGLNASSILTQEERTRRIELLYTPFHQTLERVVKEVRPEVVLSAHSFTPLYEGQKREIEVGVLYNHENDKPLAEKLLAAYRALGLRAELNQPWSAKEGFMYSADRFSSLHTQAVMLELRQDLLVQEEWRGKVVQATEQLFASQGPDRVSEQSLRELVNFMEDAGEGGDITPQSLAYYGCPAVSAFLLRFLDNLPDPLLTYARYDQFLKAANCSPEAQGRGANAAFKAAFPFATQRADGANEDDQLLVMQALVISLPGAHYLLLQRMILLFRRMLEADATFSPRRGLLAAASADSAPNLASPSAASSAVGPFSPGGSSTSTSVSLQRISLLFCSTFLSPLHVPGYNATASLDNALRKAQEQQVLVYLTQHYVDLFERQPVRERNAAPPAVRAVDPNPLLAEEAALWRRRAGNLKLNFSRRHFDSRAIVRAFRAWRAQSKSNRRRAEAYRQLALLKNDLLAEKVRSASLQRELFGLKEEFELRDFADQLRVQIGAVQATGSLANYHAVGGGTLSSGHIRQPAPAYTVGGSARKEPTGSREYEEKEQAAGAALVQGLGGVAGVAGRGRDLSADLAAVRALQEQDRALTSAYTGGRR